MNQTVDEPELLTEVPDILKRLALTVVKSFYETEHTAIVNLLVKHTCVKEDDLSDLLKFDKKQLRNILARLKNDKLVKQRVYKGKQADTGATITFNYFFIDYKLFVNVVKYKLDHIRNKIEHDEREATNRPSFVCTQCNKRYSDLEIDRLLDPSSGTLTCEFCSGPIDEDTTDVEQKQNSRSLLALFNEQMEQIFILLRGCEDIKLAPEILEPGPAMCMKQLVPRSTSSSADAKQGWSTKEIVNENLYEHDIKINMGDEKVNEETRKAKETPLWISQSTVGPVSEAGSYPSSSAENATPTEISQTANHEIMKDLLAHENKKPKLDENVKTLREESSDESDAEFSNVAETSQGEKNTQADSEDDEDITVKIGDKNYALDDITDEMIEKMTPEEHEAYMKAYQEAFSHLY